MREVGNLGNKAGLENLQKVIACINTPEIGHKAKNMVKANRSLIMEPYIMVTGNMGTFRDMGHILGKKVSHTKVTGKKTR